MKKQIITLMCATTLLSSCHIYKSYDRPEDITAAGLYRDTTIVNDTLAADTANFGNLPWREVFTDPQLQALIEQALANNPDLRSAALNVKKAEAALMSARLAYAPTLALSPQGTVSSWDKGKATQTYSLPVTASWQIDLFGQILNPKRNLRIESCTCAVGIVITCGKRHLGSLYIGTVGQQLQRNAGREFCW